MLVHPTFAALTLASGALATASGQHKIMRDFETIEKYLAQLSPYQENPADVFGVHEVGLPDGCQVEQVHTLQRHSQRFPTSYYDDGPNDERLAATVANFTKANANTSFTGPLNFLNSYQYQQAEGYLTGLGADTEFASGVSFWNAYGRTLYNARAGQLQYDPRYDNGTARLKPVIRTTGQSRIQNSQISWALGFFGPSFYGVADPELASFANGSLFDMVVIPEGGVENNILASDDSCFKYLLPDLAYIGDERLLFHAPSGFEFNNNDTYAVQSICAYDHAYLGRSDFCNLFTEEEWMGFEQTLDIEYYYDYRFGNPTGRAQGVGYQQELLARLLNQYITTSNSSVNSTITDNAKYFPLGRRFYADFSHDDIIVSALASMSVDNFRDAPDLTKFPPDKNRHFNLKKMTPFGARLITEVIGCAAVDPAEVQDERTFYYPTQYGYDASNAANKFIRMRLNNGIVPLDTIRGGMCRGRTDGLCSLDKFVASQTEAMKLANYDFACFANYTLPVNTTDGYDWDGTISSSSTGIEINNGTITAEYISQLFGY